MTVCSCFQRQIKSILNYANERPPIGVFFIFIVTLAMSCMILAIYFQRSGKIVDHEATDEYKNIFNKLGKISYCLSDATQQYNNSERQELLNQHGETTFVNLSIPAYLSFSSKGNISTLNRESVIEVTGIIPYFYIFSTDDHVHSVGFHAFLEEALCIDNDKFIEKKTIKSCIVLTVNRDALPKEHLKSFCQAKPLLKGNNHSSSVIHMSVAPSTPSASAPSIKHVPNEEGLLFMSLGLDKNFEPVAYLNILNKGIISGRLSTTSCVLFGIVVALFLYALLRGNTIVEYRKVEQNVS